MLKLAMVFVSLVFVRIQRVEVSERIFIKLSLNGPASQVIHQIQLDHFLLYYKNFVF